MDISEYKTEASDDFRRYTRRGYVDYSDASVLSSLLSNLIHEACGDSDLNAKDLFQLSWSIFKRWADRNVDDSQGQSLRLAEAAVSSWKQVAEEDSPDYSQEKMMRFLLKHLDQVHDFYRDRLYDFLRGNFKRPKQLQEKETFLRRRAAQVQKDHPDSYEIRQIRALCIRIMGERNEEIEKIRKEASGSDDMDARQALADVEMAYGNEAEAVKIHESLAEKEDAFPYGSHKNREWLRDYDKSHGNQKAYADQVRKLVFLKPDDWNYYRDYKALFSSEQWPGAQEELFAGMDPDSDQIYSLLKREGRYDLLMDHYEKYGRTGYFLDDEKELRKRYPQRCYQYLLNQADWWAEHGNRRADYHFLAEILQHLKAYDGGKEKSEELKEQYSRQYPKKTAMIQILSKV